MNARSIGPFVGPLLIAMITAIAAALIVGVEQARQPISRKVNKSPEYLAKREKRNRYLDRAEQLLEAGRGAESEALFRKALAVFPKTRSADAETGIAEALAQQGRIQEAVQIYRDTAEEFGQGWPELLLKYGRMCDRAGLQAEATAAYRRAFAVQAPDSFPVNLPPNASDVEVRRRAQAALRTYQQGQPDWQVEAERKMRASGEIRGAGEE